MLRLDWAPPRLGLPVGMNDNDDARVCETTRDRPIIPAAAKEPPQVGSAAPCTMGVAGPAHARGQMKVLARRLPRQPRPAGAQAPGPRSASRSARSAGTPALVVGSCTGVPTGTSWMPSLLSSGHDLGDLTADSVPKVIDAREERVGMDMTPYGRDHSSSCRASSPRLAKASDRRRGLRPARRASRRPSRRALRTHTRSASSSPTRHSSPADGVAALVDGTGPDQRRRPDACRRSGS